MIENAFVFSLIARRIPAIWDVINQGGYAELNPQPLPPAARALISELNPQPLPPGPPPEVYGARVGVELARLAWVSEKTGQTLEPVADWDDNPCGNVPFKLPSWLVPHPHPGPDPEPWWLEGYFVGLVCALAVAHVSPARATTSEFVEGALRESLDSLGQIGTSYLKAD